ncbi:MAG: histidine phosphatase family protein [Zetaproteobacteria bacterium CG12_big_fil_rev_8_21_14_0_65_54_13]|nr:MAG: histidine phosphatase family protein [Zetaproteobacteria bacterium CG1_02_53_45]PIW47557.1 MAG: histidine phosphatase family protein [Zetaproteobacteria bacterium CG12_big_fil_rev_8_21_14_0_65_54_13]PIX55204.1 MAG: histidine phosphatase family protein [Zetaproteobacteria bacterium CG_4_10_14_3_um_filter_54_28]PJA28086.1 MAG: histidine phosphatase family protein [Zetaproteobacteria bacterium CG_4_9_14_3_um_filter_54_145]
MHIKLMTTLVLLLPSMLIAVAQSATAGQTEVYFVRHAETMGNLTHSHSKQDDRTLSPEGIRQVEELTRSLEQLNIDYIVVSPKQRALKTILPYLKKHRLTAEIWPELAECCWQKEHRQSSAFDLKRGEKIELTSGMAPWFSFAAGDSHYSYDTRNYSEGILQTLMAADRLKKRFGQSDKTILVVGHYHAGSRLLEILQGMEPVGRYKLSNTSISHLVEQPNGTFDLLNQHR